MMHLDSARQLLEKEIIRRNNKQELTAEKPDPLLVASQYRNETVALVCALFAYGNAGQIVKFLHTLDFSLLSEDDTHIKEVLSNRYYRFQNSGDVASLFIALKRIKEIDTIENIFYKGYKKENNILEGLWGFIDVLNSVYTRDTQGYRFLVGKIPQKLTGAGIGTYKRYMMYLRWMVRDDNLDLGLWSKIDKKDLLMPLDTHTFKVSRTLGLLKRKTYDMKASIELTEQFKKWDENDPIKYDFALYRLGQEKII